jgi:hypothetical protein
MGVEWMSDGTRKSKDILSNKDFLHQERLFEKKTINHLSVANPSLK